MKLFLMLGFSILYIFSGSAQSKKLSKPEKVFESFWKTFNENYAHFETRNVTWQKQYDKYRTQINHTTSDDELFDILSKMVEPLRDGHVVISRTGDLPASAKYSDFHARFPTKKAISELREIIIKTMQNLGFTDFVKFNSKQFQIGGFSFSENYVYLQLNGFGGLPLQEFEKQLNEMILKSSDKKLTLTVDAAESRGFAYHSGISFSMFVPGAAQEIGRGGRYRIDGSKPEFDMEATGFTVYVETLRGLLPTPVRQKRVLIADGISDVTELQKQGFVAIYALSEYGKDDEEAKRLGCGHIFKGGKLKAL
ncbi:MAG: ATP phosphoribosyltransferase regulatory subunit [Verrucomicrobia bacterium]|nr:ATP phosphoribosyltransferase regulatory subunit [Cytophagales bacterium]